MRRPWLVPLVPLYSAALSARALALRTGLEQRRRLQWPVVSVGSISAGGAGKTPLIVALARLLTAHGIVVDVLSRGYGRDAKHALTVDPEGDAETYGDEPLLIARKTGVPVFVARERWQAGQMAEARTVTGSALHLLDDGMQHRQLERALEITLVSAEDLRDHLLPAGNLREPLRALHRADVLAVREDHAEARAWARKMLPKHEVWTFARTMTWPAEMPRRVVAFCGIARPEQFLQGLRAGGIMIAAHRTLRDHQRYSAQEIEQLGKNLCKSGAEAFVTTAKDLARLGRTVEELRQFAPVFCVDLEIRFQDSASIVERVRTLLPHDSSDVST